MAADKNLAVDEIANAVPATLVLRGSRNLRRRTRLFNFSAFFAVIWALAAIGTRRPELLGLAAPFLMAVVGSLILYKPPDLTANLRLGTDRLVEGASTTVFVEVASTTGLQRVEIELTLGARLVADGTTRAVTSVAPGKSSFVGFGITAEEWGLAAINGITIRTTDRFGLFGGYLDFITNDTIRISLPEERGQLALEAERFRSIVGSHLSNDRGQGQEIADIRPYQPGDSMKSINWRISNRRQEPWVTLRHPDRSTTMVVVVDAHEGDTDHQRAMQRRSANAALSLARSHLAMHDQVGVLVVGHTLRWLPPKLGRNHLFHIADSLIALSNAPEASLRLYRPPAVASIPSEAIVVAVTPLLDPLMTALIAELRSRGNPVSALVPGIDEQAPRRLSAASVQQLNLGALSSRYRHADESRRLALLEQRIGMQSLRERGVAIVPWPSDEPVANVVRTLHRLRQSMTRARAS